MIQQKTGKLLRDIISQEGNEAFKKIEEEVNASVEAENSVIAPGGSAIYSPKAMEHFRNIGTVIYLKLDYETVAERLATLRQGVWCWITGRHSVTYTGKEYLSMKNMQTSR